LYLGAIGSLTYFATVLREMSNSLEIQRMLFPSCRCSLRRKDQSSAFSIKTSLALGPFSGHGTIIGLSVKWPPFRLAVSKKRPTFRLAKTQRYLDEFCYRWNRRHLANQLASRLIASCALCPPITYSSIS